MSLLQQQLNYVKNKKNIQKNNKQPENINITEHKDTFTIKLGASVEIPRFNHPCVYFSNKTLQQYELDKKYNSVQLNNLFYRAYPAVIDDQYCSPFNVNETEMQLKFVKQLEFKLSNVVDVASQIIITIDENLQMKLLPHLQQYLLQILNNSILNTEQQLMILVNGVHNIFKIYKIKSQNNTEIKEGIVYQNTKLIIQNPKDNIQNTDKLEQLKNILSQINQLSGFSEQLFKIIYQFVFIKFMQGMSTNDIYQIIQNKQDNTKQKILNQIIEKYNVLETNFIIYGDPGCGKSHFFYIIHSFEESSFRIEFLQNNDEFEKQLEEFQLRNQQEMLIVFIDELDQYNTMQQQMIKQNILNKQIFTVAATNRPQCVQFSYFQQQCKIQQSIDEKQEQIQYFINQKQKFLKNEQLKMFEVSQHELNVLINKSRQYSAADLDMLLQNSYQQFISQQQIEIKFVQFYFQLIKYTHPSNLKQYSLANKQNVILKGYDQLYKLIINLITQKVFDKNLLFYGLPGAGKGQLIKYIASQNNISVLTVNASEISSPYVGQTEINLKNIFQSASQMSILFLDELDVLFSVEDKQNQHSLRLLSTFNQLVDQQQCLLIGATNRPYVLQQQVINRFYYKQYFGYLSTENCVQLLNSEIGQYYSKDLQQLIEYILSAHDEIVENPFDQQQKNKHQIIQFLDNKTGAQINQFINELKILMINENQLTINCMKFTNQVTQFQKQHPEHNNDGFQRINDFHNKWGQDVIWEQQPAEFDH